MRIAIAAVALLSFAGLAAADQTKNDKSDTPPPPEQGAVLRNPQLPGGALKNNWKGRAHIDPAMSGAPDGGVSHAGFPRGEAPHAGFPQGGRNTGAQGTPARGRQDGTHGHPSGGWHDGPGGSRGDGGRHHPGRPGGVIVIPYPGYPAGTWWPYPPYPYPPYPYSDDGEDDTSAGPDVPADLPEGATPFWYYCDRPDGYYPYVKSCSHDWSTIPISPPPPGAAIPLSYSDWQWCEDSKSFFPYVSSCRSGFVSMPVTAPKSDAAPAVANWFFCEDPRGYLPYVIQCKKDWRAVPSVPPPSVPITVKDAGKKP